MAIPFNARGQVTGQWEAQRNPYASRQPFVTGSLGRKAVWHRQKQNDKVNEEDEFGDD